MPLLNYANPEMKREQREEAIVANGVIKWIDEGDNRG
jgi:hypothetical protein